MFAIELSDKEAVLIEHLMQMIDEDYSSPSALDAADMIIDKLHRSGFRSKSYAKIYLNDYDQTINASIVYRD